MDNTTTTATPTFLWTGVTGAERYEIWINRIDVQQSRVVHDTNVLVASYTVQTSLLDGVYRVWVRAISEMGETSFWSKQVDFTVAALPSHTDAPLNDLLMPGGDSDATTAPQIAMEPVLTAAPESGAVAMLSPQMTVDALTPDVAEVSTAESNETVEDLDSVMSDWEAADWWSGATREKEKSKGSTSVAAALGLGFLAAQPVLKKKSVGRKQIRT